MSTVPMMYPAWLKAMGMASAPTPTIRLKMYTRAILVEKNKTGQVEFHLEKKDIKGDKIHILKGVRTNI